MTPLTRSRHAERAAWVAGAVAASAAILLLLAWSLWPHHEDPPSTADIERAAIQWVGTGRALEARPDDGGWEVDVARPDGSLVEVTIGPDLELQQLDEELGPGGGPTADLLRGDERTLAVAAARRAVGPAEALDVEREPDGDIEVDLRRRDGQLLEVGLCSDLRVCEIAPESPGDE